MKKTLTTILTAFLVALLSLSLFCGCNVSGTAKATIVEQTDTLVVIKVEKVNSDCTLLSVMEQLKEDGKLSFVEAGGMITEINGVKNPADYSSCWLLYTSDMEMANLEWGTLDYNNTTLGSAILGAEALLVSEGCFYAWNYQSFF